MDSATIGFVVKLKYVAVEKTLNFDLSNLKLWGLGGPHTLPLAEITLKVLFLVRDESQTLWSWQMTQGHRTFRVPLAD